jgi:hypothetical protein
MVDVFVLYVGSRRSVRWLDYFLAAENDEPISFWRLLNVVFWRALHSFPMYCFMLEYPYLCKTAFQREATLKIHSIMSVQTN